MAFLVLDKFAPKDATLLPKIMEKGYIDWGDGGEPTNNTFCTTQGNTSVPTDGKVVASCTGFELVSGNIVAIRFKYAVTANSTLNVESTGAKAINYHGLPIKANVLFLNDMGVFVYDGTAWNLVAVDRSSSNSSKYANCTSETSDSVKSITVPKGYYLETGNQFIVKFTNAFAEEETKLKLLFPDKTVCEAAKPMKYNDSTTIAIEAGDTATIVYDGTDYQVQYILKADDKPEPSETIKVVDSNNLVSTNDDEGVPTVKAANTLATNAATSAVSGKQDKVDGLANGTGTNSVVEGSGTAYGDYSHAEGSGTASTDYAHAEGSGIAQGSYSHAEGEKNYAEGEASHAEGYQTHADGGYSHAEGEKTTASFPASHAEGHQTTTEGYASHAEGYASDAGKTSSKGTSSSSTTRGYASHAEGYSSYAYGAISHAEGNATLARGHYAHSEGKGTTASGNMSHAEGNVTTAAGVQSHTEGMGTKADPNSSSISVSASTESTKGWASHAEGYYSNAYGAISHAEGNVTLASGNNAHSEGKGTVASGTASHAEGEYTQATHEGEHASGKYNVSNSSGYGIGETLFSVGAGTSDTDRSNAFEVTTTGDAFVKGKLVIGKERDGSTSYTDVDSRINTLENKVNTVAALVRKSSSEFLGDNNYYIDIDSDFGPAIIDMTDITSGTICVTNYGKQLFEVIIYFDGTYQPSWGIGESESGVEAIVPATINLPGTFTPGQTYVLSILDGVAVYGAFDV